MTIPAARQRSVIATGASRASGHLSVAAMEASCPGGRVAVGAKSTSFRDRLRVEGGRIAVRATAFRASAFAMAAVLLACTDPSLPEAPLPPLPKDLLILDRSSMGPGPVGRGALPAGQATKGVDRGGEADAAPVASHIPGATSETAAEGRGALRYVELGCIACHAPPGAIRRAHAPDHAAVGLLGAEALRQAIRHPESTHPPTMMPAYAEVLDEAGGEGELLAFLLARRGPPPASAPAGADKPCGSCHAAAAAAPAGWGHRCVYISDRREELSCARCHDALPAGGRCAFVDEHRPTCTICHETLPSETK